MAQIALLGFPFFLFVVCFGSTNVCEEGEHCSDMNTQDTSILLQAHATQSSGTTSESNLSVGHRRCPCLTLDQTDESTAMGGTFPERIYMETINGTLRTVLPDCNDAGKEWDFPEHIGIGQCTSFDGLPPFCGQGTADSPKTWTDPWMCEMKFCIVDPNNCTKDWYIPGNLFPGLSFSYRTCAKRQRDKKEIAQIKKMTEMLKNDHRAYHCAGGKVDSKTQADADAIQNART